VEGDSSREPVSIYNPARQRQQRVFLRSLSRQKIQEISERRRIIMRFVVLPGDGIGPEISAATVEVLQLLNTKLNLGLAFELHEIGLMCLMREGTTFPAPVLEACRSADGIVLGPVSHSNYPSRAEGGINVSGELRIQLDLFANIRPCRSRKGLPSWGQTAMDLVIVRENTEGFYSDRNMFWGVGEFMPTPDAWDGLRIVRDHFPPAFLPSLDSCCLRRSFRFH
jgi:isocitrate dehydrogenase